MAQRHESLISLSRDHYEGLLLALQIKTADRVIMVGWPKEAADQAKFIAKFYQDHLKKHFKEEEEALFPLIVRSIPSGKPQVEDLLSDHRKIEDYIGKFEADNPEDLPARLGQFSDLLERHIRKEERELFPLFEKEAPAEILENARQLLSRE